MIEFPPDIRRLVRSVAQCADVLRPFAGTVYRSTTPRYANQHDLLSGEGAAKWGGRWNPRSIPTVYFSLSVQTAGAEGRRQLEYYNLPVHAQRPRVIVPAHVNLASVLDITDPAIERRLDVSRQMLTSVDWRCENADGNLAITQVVGQSAHDAGFEGLIAPSNPDETGSTLVVFTGNIAPTSRMTRLGDEALPE